ncbi:MAG: hypothetical protein EAZ95_18085 [Bacteroidetes bacterium]|nr:MAG: hypothetical protein EAZ95_18085 [Bacteroidota bacterium]
MIKKEIKFNESEILEQLNLAFNGVPSVYYPVGRPEDIKYNFFLDLEHGYCETAGNSIHLYADSTRWVIVFEKSGYQNRSKTAEIELYYVGNCIDYPIEKQPERNYITNVSRLILIDSIEFERIENKDGAEMERFELIGQNIEEIKIRDKFVSYDNPKKRIKFGDLIRYLHETNPTLISATEDEIQKHIPKDIPKLMKIDEFHFISSYEDTNLPSQQETYKLIAKVLTTGDTTNWKTTQKPNNSWKNWKSGHL